MNEEDLRALVVRARDAEGSLSQPPPGLVGQARTAARRRHRAVSAAAGGVVAAVALTSFAVPRLLDDETDPVVDHSLSGVDTGELAAHGGPCPSALPTPIDDVDGHGFGTSTSAERKPRLAAPETAWVCQYSAQEKGKTGSGGTAYEWLLTNTPRRLDDAFLSEVTQAMNAIAVDPDRGARPCPANLGPRYALVTSAGGDLTGVVVDDYGCQEVRLTDDPFMTAPGDPQQEGTVPGVLTGSDSFAATLATWWDISPADVESRPTSEEPRVTIEDLQGKAWHPLAKYVPDVGLFESPADKGMVKFLPDGTWTGFDGCNPAGGTYKLTSNKLKMTGGAVTDIGCANMSPEEQLGGALLMLNRSATRLTATDAQGRTIVEYAR